MLTSCLQGGVGLKKPGFNMIYTQPLNTFLSDYLKDKDLTIIRLLGLQNKARDFKLRVTKAMTTGFCASTSRSASNINAFNFTY